MRTVPLPNRWNDANTGDRGPAAASENCRPVDRPPHRIPHIVAGLSRTVGGKVQKFLVRRRLRHR